MDRNIEVEVLKGGGEDPEDEDGEPLFYDALSRLNSSIPYNSHNTETHKDLSLVNGVEGLGDNHHVFLHSRTPTVTEATSQDSLDRKWFNEDRSLKSTVSSLSKRFGKSLSLETQGCSRESMLFIGSSDHDDCKGSSPASASASSRSLASPIFPAKCQSEGIGWPFGISSCRFDSRQRKPMSCTDGRSSQVSYSNIVSPTPTPPPVPPSPSTGSWLNKVITLHGSKTSPLSILQEREKALSAETLLPRKKLDFVLQNSKELTLTKSWTPSARKKLDFALQEESPLMGSDFTCVAKSPNNDVMPSTFNASSELVVNAILLPSVMMHQKHKISSSSSSQEKKKTKKGR